MNVNELRTFNDFLKMKYQGSRDGSIREILECCDVVYPEVERFVEEHKPTHRNGNSATELEFYIKVPDYFYNIGNLIEEHFDKSYHDHLYEFIYEELYWQLENFMEENAPKRKYYTEGRSGGYLVVEHEFELHHIHNYSTEWNCWSRREKLEHIQYYGIGMFSMVSALDEMLFWYDFEEKLEETRKSLQSKEFAQDYLEYNLKDVYAEWVQNDHDRLENLLAQVS